MRTYKIYFQTWWADRFIDRDFIVDASSENEAERILRATHPDAHIATVEEVTWN